MQRQLREWNFDAFLRKSILDFHKYRVFYFQVVGALKPNAKKNIDAVLTKRLENNNSFRFIQNQRIAFGNFLKCLFYHFKIFFISNTQIKIEAAHRKSCYIDYFAGNYGLVGDTEQQVVKGFYFH